MKQLFIGSSTRLLFFIFSVVTLHVNDAAEGASSFTFIRRVVDQDLYYAAESRNYREDEDTLFVTTRGGGLKVFNISEPGQFSPLSRWETSAPVEGQDRLEKEWLVVAELGVGPDGPFPESTGPKLHFLDVAASPNLPERISPVASVDLSGSIDAILHVKFLRPSWRPTGETWVVCTGGFATSVLGAVVLVNVTSLLSTPAHWSAEEAARATSVLSIPAVSQPEGVLVAPLDSRFVYVGGINSTSLAIVDVTSFLSPTIVQVRESVGPQLVAATWKDQPLPLPKGTSRPKKTRLSYENMLFTDIQEGNDETFDEGLVFMAAWGLKGGLLVLDTNDNESSSTSAANPKEVARHTDLRLSEANRVKLAPWAWRGANETAVMAGDGGVAGDLCAGVAFLPLELERGGFAALRIPPALNCGRATTQSPNGGGDGESPLWPAEVVHVPLSEFVHDDVVAQSTKAYCLALSSSRFVYLFIAETASVYIYRFDGDGTKMNDGKMIAGTI